MRTFGRGEPGYPEGLLALSAPPARLHVRGGALPRLEHAVAIVGARAATPYGLGLAERLARDLAARGLTVVSGLAHGIDAAAHRGALAGGGRTVAVIASACDRVTPPDHEPLAARIAERGAVLSEVAHGGPFGRGAFVRRNRLIAAMSAVTVVVEAGARSGALGTAELARTLGRPVLAVPGDVDRPLAQGPLALLRRGARLCVDAADVLAVLPAALPAQGPEERLLAALGESPESLEALAARAGLEGHDALARLLRLRWSGSAVAHPGGRWSARPR